MVDVGKIMDYEAGEMDDNDVIDMFADLVSDGTINQLQGHYGRTAASLIDHGFIDHGGNVLMYSEDL